MTMPHLMNCPHRDDGWCSECVMRLGNEHIETRSALDAARARCERNADMLAVAGVRAEQLEASLANVATAAEQAAKERDEARAERDAAYSDADATCARWRAAEDTRDRLAVEVQALRAALRASEEGHALMRSYLGHQDQDANHAWMAEKMRGFMLAASAALSAPSESERVLRERDERTRADERAKCDRESYADVAELGRVIGILRASGINAEWVEGEMLSKISPSEGVEQLREQVRAAALEEAAIAVRSRVEESDNVEESLDIIADRAAEAVRLLAATPPSATSGKCATCGGEKMVRNTHVPRLDDPEWWPCPTCAASGKVTT